MFNPEKRSAVEQHIAQGATPEGSQPGHNADTNRIEFAPRRLYDAKK